VLLFGSIGPLTIAPHIMKLGYDPFTDLAPISGGVNFPNVLVVHKGAGVKNLAEFVAKAKKPRQRGLCLDRRGLGLAPGGRAVQPARRRGDGARALQGRRTGPAGPAGRTRHLLLAAPPTALPHVETGKLIPLATTG
jgi:tripartite-type tricarboxylate transporter receptor subunit TctC